MKIPDRLIFCWHRNSLRGVNSHMWVIPLFLLGNSVMQQIYLNDSTLQTTTTTTNYLPGYYFGSPHPCEGS